MYFPKRKEIRLKEYDYSANGAYFVTVCTKDKKHLFWDKEKMRLKKKKSVGADNIRPEDIDLSRTGEFVKEAINTNQKQAKQLVLKKYSKKK